MRITNALMYDLFLSQMDRFRNDQLRYSEQISTGRRVNRPSDDAPDHTSLMSLRHEVSRLARYNENIQTSASRLQGADERLNDLGIAMTRVVQLAEQGSSSVNTRDGLRGIAEEVKQIHEQFMSLAGSQVADRYIFSGTYTTRASIPTTPSGLGEVFSFADDLRTVGSGITGAAVTDRDGYNEHLYRITFTDNAGAYEVRDLDDNRVVTTGTITVGAPDSIAFENVRVDYDVAAAPAPNTYWDVLPQYVYNGNENHIELQVDENTAVVTNVPGNEAFGGAPGAPGGSVFDELVDLRLALLTGDTQSVASSLCTASDRLNEVSRQRAIVGGRISNLRSYGVRSNQRTVDVLTKIAEKENVDLPEAISKLVQTEGGLEAALQVGARLGQLNLFDYIR